MISEVLAKGILNHIKQPDDWFGLKYNMNLYRGCQHRCIYCDSRSECYQIENFDREVRVKVNAVDLLADALPRKRLRGTIGTGSMNDPYMPVEKQVNLTGRALTVIAENRFPVHILTKSDLVLKDLDTIKQINEVFAAVSFTVTTADDMLGKILEPGAPEVSRRFKAMKILADAGINDEQISVVIRTGGSSQIAAVRQLLEQRFPDRVTEHDPFSSVAAGLAIANYHGYRFA